MVWVNERTVDGCRNWIIPPQVGGTDNVGDISKIISYFVHQALGWKDSFFQTEYIIQEVLGQDGSHTKRDVVSMLNLSAEAHVIKKVVKQRRD